MGKLLVATFLFSLAVAVVTAVLLGISVLVAVLSALSRTLSSGRLVAPSLAPLPPGLGLWFLAAGVYLLLILPLALLVVVLVGFRRRSARPAAVPPPRWTTMDKAIVVVLTALDDEASIGPAVDEVRALSEVGTVIVADNRSQDATAKVARDHGAHVVTVRERGYGHTCIEGLREALRTTKAEVIVLLEGDMTFFAEDLRKLVPYLADCEMALGTRTNRELNRPGSQMDWFAAWGNLFLAFLIRLRYWDSSFLGAVQLTDVGCTFRAVRREALERILPQLTVGGMYFSPHMILVALRNGLSVVEAPIKFRERVGASKGAGHSRRRALSIGLEMLKEITLH